MYKTPMLCTYEVEVTQVLEDESLASVKDLNK